MLPLVVLRWSDNDAWAEARSLLDRRPLQTAQDQRNRRRATVVVFVAAAVLGVVALAVVVTALVAGSGPAPARQDVPAWQGITGVALSGLGLALQITALVVYRRGAGPARKWPSPLRALTREQRKELLGEVRGDRPPEPDHLPLARHLAAERSRQVGALPQSLGSLVLCLGIWTEHPNPWFLLFIGVLTLYLAAAWVFTWRISRQARRFLDLYGLTADR